MIALPVLAVTAADVLIQTSDVSGVESIDRRMGSAEALVSVSQGIEHGRSRRPTPMRAACSAGRRRPRCRTAEQVSSMLDGARLLELRTTGPRWRPTDGRATRARSLEVDLADP